MCQIIIKNYIFKPGLIPSIITLALLYLMISLGNWQLERANYKSNLQSIIENRQNIEPIPLGDLTSKAEDDWLYHPTLVSGVYDIDHQIFFDNQVHNMVAGYSVFTPLKLNQDTGILINRGWLAVGKSRNKLPDINLDKVTAENISGLLSLPPSKGVVLSNFANDYMHWPVVLQYIDTIEIENELGYKLLPMVLIVDDLQNTSLEIMPVKINMRSEKHTAYAFQWYALSLTLLIIYIIVNTKKTNQVYSNE